MIPLQISGRLIVPRALQFVLRVTNSGDSANFQPVWAGAEVTPWLNAILTPSRSNSPTGHNDLVPIGLGGARGEPGPKVIARQGPSNVVSLG